MEKSKKVNELEDIELCSELDLVENQLSGEYSILANLKSRKKEIQDEINRRFRNKEV